MQGHGAKTAADANKPYGKTKSSQRKFACIYIFFDIRIRNMTDCVDNHEHCEFWAGIGECDNNPDYMLVKCKKSAAKSVRVKVTVVYAHAPALAPASASAPIDIIAFCMGKRATVYWPRSTQPNYGF